MPGTNMMFDINKFCNCGYYGRGSGASRFGKMSESVNKPLETEANSAFKIHYGTANMSRAMRYSIRVRTTNNNAW